MVAMRLLAASSSPATCAAPAATVPELPEVETVRAGAEPHLRGRRLRRYEQTRPDLRWPLPEAALRALVGRTCTAVERRSKYLLLRFDGDGAPAAIVHLGMTGRLLVDALDGTAPRPEWRKHEHWRMDFGDRLVRFVDPRRFGALDVADAADLPTHPLLAVLGQEPLQPGFDGGFLRRVSRGKKANVKALLMDGRILVGVGNIYASEACWRARVRPRSCPCSLGPRTSHHRAHRPEPGRMPAAPGGRATTSRCRRSTPARSRAVRKNGARRRAGACRARP